MTTNTTTATAATMTVPAEITAQPATPTTKQEPCGLCGLIGKHGLPEQPATCVICGAKHGDVVKREIPRGNRGKMVLVDRKVVVAHSCLALRSGGLKEDGVHFVNPSAPWEAQPVCDDCAYGLGREVSNARKEAYDAGGRRHEVEPRFPYPRIAALSLVTKWVNDENAHEGRVRAAEAKRRAEAQAARQAEADRKARLAAIVAKGGRWHRSGYERRGSVPALPTIPDRTAKNGGRRNDRGGKRHDAPAAYVAEVDPADAADLAEYASAQA